MSEITTIGLDLAKRVFQVHGVDTEGKGKRSVEDACRRLSGGAMMGHGRDSNASVHQWRSGH